MLNSGVAQRTHRFSVRRCHTQRRRRHLFHWRAHQLFRKENRTITKRQADSIRGWEQRRDLVGSSQHQDGVSRVNRILIPLLLHVDWLLCSEHTFEINRERAIDYLNTRENVYVFDGFAGWDPKYRIKVRVIASRAYHALFMVCTYPYMHQPTPARAHDTLRTTC